jgi:hypothetical protein
MNELKPCPFCEGVNLNLNCDDKRLMCDTVECNGCGALVPSSEWSARADRWISVDDNLPVSAKGQWSQPVIAMSDAGLIYKLSYFNGDDSGCWQRTSSFAESASKIVTHWMPLPVPPKAVK